MKYLKNTSILENRTVWIIELENLFSNDKTLLLSKVSEAILPNKKGNHIGEGATMDVFLENQLGIRFIINGGFNHYRKNFYKWNHKDFNIGDPVGIIKIRNHYFEDYLNINYYGFFVQDEKNKPWRIKKYNEITKNEKYILGCTPLLIFNCELTNLPIDEMIPVKNGEVNPPSMLGHGLQNHPRTAVGIKDNKIFFVVVEKEGCTLLELQDIGANLKLDYFLNLDGGGSTQFKLLDKDKWITNNISYEDKNRVLGNVIVLFEENLK